MDLLRISAIRPQFLAHPCGKLLTAPGYWLISCPRQIELAGGNQAKAARWLGVSRLTTREKLHQFGIHPAQEQADG